jgi:hypothetical protein
MGEKEKTEIQETKKKKNYSHTQTPGRRDSDGSLMYSPVNSPDEKSDTRQEKVPN